MDIQAITAALRENYGAFMRDLDNIPEAGWTAHPPRAADAAPDAPPRWSPGQQLDHIIRAVRPVTLAFGLPLWLLRLLFGVSNRPSRSYDALVARYHQRLASGGRASGPFIPPPARWEDKSRQLAALDKQLTRLQRRLNTFEASQLDRYLLPHPLLGKLTLREMLYFTIYHVTHHRLQLQ